MLTLEEKISQICKEIPESTSYRNHLELCLSLSEKASKFHFGDLLLKISEIFNLLSNEIESDWEQYGKPENISNYQKILELLKEMSSEITKISKEDAENRRRKGDVYFVKGLRETKKTINHLCKVLNDTLNFIEVASEVRELRHNPLDKDKIEEARKILSLL